MMNLSETFYYNLLKDLAEVIGDARELVMENNKDQAVVALAGIEKTLYDAITEGTSEIAGEEDE